MNASSRLGSVWARMVPRAFGDVGDEEIETARARLRAVTPVPVIWLLGKAQSGKSTVIRFLTGADAAVIGAGFRPETRGTIEHAFPDEANVLVRFLDTRGLGEKDYDPAADIRGLNERAHLVVVTARVTDHALEAVLRPLADIRAARPRRPVLLVLTCLHQAYPGRQHPVPDPFGASASADSVPEPLGRHLSAQFARFARLADRIVPVDITRPAEGFAQPEFGGERLRAALLDLLPEGYAETLRAMHELIAPLVDLHERRAMPTIHAHALLAASAAAAPIPWIDLPTVVGIQLRMARAVAAIYRQSLGPEQWVSLVGAAGARLLLRQLFRETLKMFPGLGSVANSSLAYATTYALGRALSWYFGRRLQGDPVSLAEFQGVLAEQARLAERLWKRPLSEKVGP